MDRQLPSHWNNLVFPFHKSVVHLCGEGSGFLIGSQKGHSLILTCHHVIEDYVESGRVEVQLPGEGSLAGYIIHEDKDSDIALVMVMPSRGSDPVITGEPLRFSDYPHSDTPGRDLVMMGYFSVNHDTMKEPGTSHGYSMGEEPNRPYNMLADYTSQGGTSGSPVFLMGEGPSPLVIAMHTHGFAGSIERRSCLVEAIRASLNKFTQTEGMAIAEVIEEILDTFISAE